MKRRRFLHATAAGITIGTAGCLGVFDDGDDPDTTTPNGEDSDYTRPPQLDEDPADAVYYPPDVHDNEMVGMQQTGPYTISMSYSVPHEFYIITGTQRDITEPGEDSSAHLMFMLWDTETKTVIPASTVETNITKDGESVDDRTMWPMLSQRMGYHFGDNVPLEGAGTYEIEVTIAPVEATPTGGISGAYGEEHTVTFELDFDPSTVEELGTYPNENAGEEGAVSPMPMDMAPSGQLPEKGDMPGTVLGEATSDDTTLIATALDSVPEGIDGEGQYLVISAQTPYNRFPVPFMSVAATLSSGGETVYDDTLQEAFHPDLGYHYGAVVDSVQTGDSLSLQFGAPSQTSRHSGYERAFYEMEDIEF